MPAWTSGRTWLEELCFNGGFLRGGLAVVGVGDDAATGVDVRAGEADFVEGVGHHAAGHALAEADDEVVGARRELADGGDAAQEVVKGVKLAVELGSEGHKARAGDQLGGGIEMAFAQLD